MAADKQVLRCSSLPMYFDCAHSQDEAQLLIEAHNGAADLGTAGHDAMRSIVKGLPVDVEVVALRHGVDPKELGPLVAFGRKVWAEIRDAYPLPETEVEVELEYPNLKLTGHIDVLSVVEAQGRFVDWKFGRREDTDYREQVAGYGTTLVLRRGLTEVFGTVAWMRSQTVETFRFTRDDALAFVERIATHARNGRYRHGEHCAYCPRSHDCPALVAIERRDVAMFAEADVEKMVREAPAAALVDARRRLKVIEAFADSFDKALRRRIAADGPLDSGDDKDLALVEENGKREIKTAKAWPLVQPLLEAMDDDELGEVLSISAAGLDEVVAKKAPKRGGAAAKRALRAELEAVGALEQPRVLKLKEVRRALPPLPEKEIDNG